MARLIALVTALLFDPAMHATMSALVLAGEVVLNLGIISLVPYTEIDWGAYMDEVEGVVNGTMDYTQLRGDTGPLVYPAGFVYIYLALYYATNLGANIARAQYIFVGLYVAHLGVVHSLYARVRAPPYLLLIMSAGYRIHSIFVLRLFNDPVAMLLLYAAVALFLRERWTAGCVLFSLAVSVKMNILLFAPGLGLLLVEAGGLRGAVPRIALCGLIQVALAVPFLLDNWWGYLERAFNFGRQFDYKWTVNWRCIGTDLFLDRRFHVALLAGHLAVLAAFFFGRWRRNSLATSGLAGLFARVPEAPSPRRVLLVLFTSNFVGMVFARSLHYQFYCWYFHTLPFLMWSVELPAWLGVGLLAVIEVAWNTYPSTPASSAALHGAHLLLLARLWTADWSDGGAGADGKKRA